MDGLLVVAKPSGCTSHDVVATVRRALKIRRVGHAGTLDPIAEGVLLVLVGKATRFAEYLSSSSKCYRAGLLLGRRTDTDDISGNVVSESDASGIAEENLREALNRFLGEILQIPPVYSAVKQHGKPLYKLARQGKTVERKPRPVTVYSNELVSFTAGVVARAIFECEVSSGTYIRTLCADIGDYLSVGGTMESLVRTRSGSFSLDQAMSLDEITAVNIEKISHHLIPLKDIVAHFFKVKLETADLVSRFLNGGTLSRSGEPSELCAVFDNEGSLLGIGRFTDDGRLLVPVKVLAGDHLN